MTDLAFTIAPPPAVPAEVRSAAADTDVALAQLTAALRRLRAAADVDTDLVQLTAALQRLRAQDPPPPPEQIGDLPDRLGDLLDHVDSTLCDVWLIRAVLAQQLADDRAAQGQPYLDLPRETRVYKAWRRRLGPDGTRIAHLLLRAGRRGVLGAPPSESNDPADPPE